MRVDQTLQSKIFVISTPPLYDVSRFFRSSRMARIRPTAAPTLAMIETSSNGVISRLHAEQQSLCSARVKGRLRAAALAHVLRRQKLVAVAGEPNELVAPTHNRMPVILPREAWTRPAG
jgi:hypothetical protein